MNGRQSSQSETRQQKTFAPIVIKQNEEMSARAKARRVAAAANRVAHEEADFTTKVSSWQTRINEETGENHDVNLKKRPRKSSAPTSPTAMITVDLHVTHRPATSYGVKLNQLLQSFVIFPRLSPTLIYPLS